MSMFEKEEAGEAVYVISVAARMVGVHAQTLRYYERVGLIIPFRSQGNRRYYSARDLERIRRIKILVEEMGMNLAGAEVVLRLMERIEGMERQLQEVTVELQQLRSRRRRLPLGPVPEGQDDSGSI